jgi:hypothetical protein
MSKKAGPKRIDPETFVPVVWRNKGVPIGTDLEFLVCKRRAYHGTPVVGACKKDGKAAEYFIHPMAIQITPRLDILTRLKIIAGNWDVDSTAKHGISERCAKVALAQAYHGIKASVDLVTMEPEFESKYSELYIHKFGVRVRNIAIAMNWTRWEKNQTSMNDRLAEFGQLGLYFTDRQFFRFVAEEGL